MFLLVLMAHSARFCSAAPNVITANVGEIDGDWSGAVDGMRGRLIAITDVNSHGTTEIRIYVEIQNIPLTPFFGKKILFNRDTSLLWTLEDSLGKPVPEWKGPVPWMFDYSSISTWISIPGDSTLRFPVCSGEYHLISDPRVLILSQGLIKTLPWHLATSGREHYFIGATFKGLEQSNIPTAFIWGSSLLLPAVALPTDPIPTVWSANRWQPIPSHKNRS